MRESCFFRSNPAYLRIFREQAQLTTDHAGGMDKKNAALRKHEITQNWRAGERIRWAPQNDGETQK